MKLFFMMGLRISFLLQNKVFLKHFRVWFSVHTFHSLVLRLFWNVRLVENFFIKDQNVLWFYVSVDYVPDMHVAERRNHLSDQILGLLFWKRALSFQVLVQVVIVGQFKNDIDAGFIVEIAVESDYIRMSKPPLYLQFFLHLPKKVVLLEHFFFKLFNRHFLLRPYFCCFIDRTKLATSHFDQTFEIFKTPTFLLFYLLLLLFFLYVGNGSWVACVDVGMVYAKHFGTLLGSLHSLNLN